MGYFIKKAWSSLPEQINYIALPPFLWWSREWASSFGKMYSTIAGRTVEKLWAIVYEKDEGSTSAHPREFSRRPKLFCVDQQLGFYFLFIGLCFLVFYSFSCCCSFLVRVLNFSDLCYQVGHLHQTRMGIPSGKDHMRGLRAPFKTLQHIVNRKQSVGYCVVNFVKYYHSIITRI